jgi:3-dehydroquinate dehydratase-2
MKLSVIQGPNLNMLGIREQHIYGPLTLAQIHTSMSGYAKENNIEIEFFQSNLEGEIIDKIQEAFGNTDGIIINPAAFSHTSIGIKDALMAVNIPTVEVHISNIYQREEFRQKSITAGASTGVITGFGSFSYHLAMISIHQIMLENIEVQKRIEEKKK